MQNPPAVIHISSGALIGIPTNFPFQTFQTTNSNIDKKRSSAKFNFPQNKHQIKFD